jgi:hypothetical protein
MTPGAQAANCSPPPVAANCSGSRSGSQYLMSVMPGGQSYKVGSGGSAALIVGLVASADPTMAPTRMTGARRDPDMTIAPAACARPQRSPRV